MSCSSTDISNGARFVIWSSASHHHIIGGNTKGCILIEEFLLKCGKGNIQGLTENAGISRYSDSCQTGLGQWAVLSVFGGV